MGSQYGRDVLHRDLVPLLNVLNRDKERGQLRESKVKEPEMDSKPIRSCLPNCPILPLGCLCFESILGLVLLPREPASRDLARSFTLTTLALSSSLSAKFSASVSSLTTALVLARQSCRIAPEYTGKSALPRRMQEGPHPPPLLLFIRDLLVDWKGMQEELKKGVKA